MNKNESKYFNTAIKMDEALIALLEKKDFEYITIKEICNVAGVNRSTFYLHYENTYDLLKETTRYIIDKHFACYEINKEQKSFKFETRKQDELLFITDEYLTPYLTFIKDNQRLFNVTIRHFDSMNMNEVYSRMFEDIFSPILTCFRVPKEEHTYVMKFYLTGIFAIIMEWLKNDCSDDIKMIIKVISDCVMGERNVNGQDVEICLCKFCFQYIVRNLSSRNGISCALMVAFNTRLVLSRFKYCPICCTTFSI